MTRQQRSSLVLLLIAITVSTGCHPTQPFYFHEDGDLSHYLDHATELSDPDVYQPQLEDVEFAEAPFTISDPEVQDMWELELEEAISIALQNSKVIRNLGGVTPFGFADALVGRTAGASTIYDAAITDTGLEQALSVFDAQLDIFGTQGQDGTGGSGIFGHTDRLNNIGGSNFNNTANGGIQAALQKRTAAGTTYRASSQTDRLRGNTFFNTEHNSIWQQIFDVSFTHPVLGPDPRNSTSIGGGTLVNRVPVVLARINTDISLATFEASVRNLVLDIENTYWDLHVAYRNLETAKIGRDSSQVTWNNIYEKKGAGVSNAQEEAQAREQYFFFRAQLETALRDLYNVENRLRYLMGIAATDGRLIRPKDEPSAARLAFDWRQIHSESLLRSAELRQQKWTIEAAELQLVTAKHRLLPQLDVGGRYTWYGAGDNLINADRNGLNFDEDGSTAFDVLTEGDFQEAALFFNFRMPVGYRSQLANVRSTQLQLVRAKARLEDMELNTSHLLTTAVRELDFNYQSAQTHFNRWKAAQAEVASVNALYHGGKITLDLVLDAQRRRAQAQIDYYRALGEYNKAIASVHYRKGSLLEYNNIMLAEGPWPEKAYWDALGRARERDASYYLNYGWTRPGVNSRGPVAQQFGDQPLEGQYIEDRPTNEVIPTPRPTPADQPEGSDDSESPGPVTNRPEGPALNPPLRAASEGGYEPKVATRPDNAYEWGSLGLDSPQPSDVQPVSFDE